MKSTAHLSFLIWACLACGVSLAQKQPEVKVIGAMRDVMWKGELQGAIDLDTIARKSHLFGLGPLEYLAGELLIIDGKAYKSTVRDSGILVEETFETKAPFFVYTNVDRWYEHALPDSVLDLKSLERYLNSKFQKINKPFVFKLSATTRSGVIHVVNLPKGVTVSSPDDAHQGEKKYAVANQSSEVIGFFSREHQGVFTHHDTFLHLHLITVDRSKMGHVDELAIKKGTGKLFLPWAP